MFEGGIRVPAIAVWPKKIRPGSTSDARGISMDLFATFCEAAGVKPAANVNGVSLLPTLQGQKKDLNRPLIWVRLPFIHPPPKKNMIAGYIFFLLKSKG